MVIFRQSGAGSAAWLCEHMYSYPDICPHCLRREATITSSDNKPENSKENNESKGK